MLKTSTGVSGWAPVWSYGLLDPGSRNGHILVLPDPDHRPPERCHMGVRLTVALDVARELGGPPLTVGRGLGGVLRAAVPEAAVDHYGDLRSGEEQVGAAPGHAGERGVHAIAQTTSVQVTAEEEFGLGIARPLS